MELFCLSGLMELDPLKVSSFNSFSPFCRSEAYNCVLCISEQGCGGHCIWNPIDMHVG